MAVITEVKSIVGQQRGDVMPAFDSTWLPLPEHI